MEREKTIRLLAQAYEKWLSDQDDPTVEEEKDYAIWGTIYYDLLSKTGKEEETGKNKKLHSLIFSLFKDRLLKDNKKSRKPLLSDTDLRQLSESIYKELEQLDLRSLWTQIPQKYQRINDKPLLVKNKTGNSLGRGKSGRRMRGVPPLSLGTRKNGRVSGLHDKKTRNRKVQASSPKSRINNKVHKARPKAVNKNLRGKIK